MTLLVMAVAVVVGLGVGLLARRAVDRRLRRRARIETTRSVEPIEFYRCTRGDPSVESPKIGRHESALGDTEILLDLTERRSEISGEDVSNEIEAHWPSGGSERG